ncbi:MAG TPA: hypothetical protein VJ696_11620 [Rhodanobacteraceae bacterium]|nr:hypothetical protein [Rhodanobacteraceae bacterium]
MAIDVESRSEIALERVAARGRAGGAQRIELDDAIEPCGRDVDDAERFHGGRRELLI